MNEWTRTSDGMPKPNESVIAYYTNSNGKGRRVRAFWVPASVLEVADDMPLGFADADGYCPEGWYESNENDETDWLIHEGVTHWMPMPEAPKP